MLLHKCLVQPSVAVTVKVCDLLQVPVITPATAVIVGVPQLLVLLMQDLQHRRSTYM